MVPELTSLLKIWQGLFYEVVMRGNNEELMRQVERNHKSSNTRKDCVMAMAVSMMGMGETTIESGVDGPSEDPSAVDEDAG
jgi:hypothetical protein